MNTIKRRSFLRFAVAGAVAAALPAFGASVSGRRVLIGGAGLAGLQAASLLEQLSCEAQVIEGRNRVGGRLLTLDHLPGHPEGGGNTIGPNYGRVIDTARRLEVALRVPPAPLPSGYVVNGARLTRETWPESRHNPLPDSLKAVTPERILGALLRDNPLPSTAAWRQPAHQALDVAATEFFRKAGLDEAALQLIDINNSYGNSLATTSILALYRVQRAFARALSMKQPLWEVADGNMRLPEKMAGALKTPPILGETIVSVGRSEGLVTLRTQSGREFHGDAAILALPATAVRKLSFTPALPADRRQAFDEMTYHKITQAHLVAHEPWWENPGETAGFWTNGPLGRIFARPIPGSDQANIIIWINGDSCDRFDRLPRDQAIAEIMRAYLDIAPAARGKVSFGELVSWAGDSFNEGAWAIWCPGQIARFADLLHRPAGRIFFAGEHTGFAYSGMEAAVASADRAVLEVMRALA